MTKNRKILVVENEGIVALSLKEGLEEMGFSVSGVVASGHAAIKKAGETRPDLVLMDIGLKGKMDGIQAAEKIREGLDVPVIYLTAYSDKNTVDRAKVTGPFGYITKPFNNDDLRSAVETSLYRSEIEKKLRESEKKYRSLVETSQDLIWKCDAEGRFTYLNKAWEKTHGYTVEEMLGRPFTEFQSAEVAKRDIKEFQRHLVGGRVTGYETIHLTKSGKEIHLVFNAIPVHDSQGGIVGTQGTAHDITDRKRVEESLRAATEEWERTFDSLSDGVSIHDFDKNIIKANVALSKILGIPSGELIGKKCYQIFHNQMESIEGCPFSKCVLSKKPEHLEFFEPHLDRWVSVSASPIFDEEGEVNGAVHVVRDITNRKLAEEVFAELSLKNELILEAAGEGIYGLDLEGRTTFVNPAAAKMIGWEVEDIVGKYQHDLLHHTKPDGKPYKREECPIYAAFTDGKVHHVNDEVFWRKDGSSFPVEYISTPIRDEDGKLSGAVVTFSDITNRKLGEDKLRRRTHDLGERVKELNCLYGISKLVEDPDISFEGVFQGTVDLIPPSWQYPEITHGRVSFGDRVYVTKGFREGEWWQEADIVAGGVEVGRVEVFYGEERPELFEGPFLKEERDLINAVAERLGDFIERRLTEEEREHLTRELMDKNKALEQIIYVTSHDLRSPLVNIQGFSNELTQSCRQLESVLRSIDASPEVKEELATILEGDIPEALHYIVSSTSKMDSLLKGVLRISRLGREALTFEQVNMNKLMSNVVKAFEFQIKEKDV
ncbi:MAG: PAS domain S-box protein, partial [Candidatus Hydrothermarchaeales archaeon]